MLDTGSPRAKTGVGWRWLGLAALALAWLIPLAACAGPAPTATPEPTPTPPPDPRIILKGAAQRLRTVQYLEFSLSHPKGNTPLAPGLALNSVDGKAQVPTHYLIDLVMEAAGSVSPVQVVSVEGDIFMTDPVSGSWFPVPPEAIPFPFAGFHLAIADLMAGPQEPSLVGEAQLEGYTAHHIRATGVTDPLVNLIPGTSPGGQVPMEFWVNQADGKLRQVQVSGALLTDDAPDTVRLIALRYPTEAPQIEAPQLSLPGQ